MYLPFALTDTGVNIATLHDLIRMTKLDSNSMQLLTSLKDTEKYGQIKEAAQLQRERSDYGPDKQNKMRISAGG